MKRLAMLLGMLLLLSNCSNVDRIPEINSFCSGLDKSFDNLNDVLLEYQTETPDPVIVASTEVIVGFDGACDG